MSQSGQVKFFSIPKGYGFISPATGGEDLFVHISDLAGNPLKEGDQVWFDVNYDERKQKEHAINVSGGSGWPLDPNRGFGGGKGGGKGFGKGKGKGYSEW